MRVESPLDWKAEPSVMAEPRLSASLEHPSWMASKFTTVVPEK
jgi:hypothetical protein